MRYALGGVESLHHGLSGLPYTPRSERLLRPWRARATRHDGTEALVRLGATAYEIRRHWEEALEDCTPDDLRQFSEVWLERFSGRRGRGRWEPIEQLSLRNLRFRASMRQRSKNRQRRQAA